MGKVDMYNTGSIWGWHARPRACREHTDHSKLSFRYSIPAALSLQVTISIPPFSLAEVRKQKQLMYSIYSGVFSNWVRIENTA